MTLVASASAFLNGSAGLSFFVIRIHQSKPTPVCGVGSGFYSDSPTECTLHCDASSTLWQFLVKTALKKFSHCLTLKLVALVEERQAKSIPNRA